MLLAMIFPDIDDDDVNLPRLRARARARTHTYCSYTYTATHACLFASMPQRSPYLLRAACGARPRDRGRGTEDAEPVSTPCEYP
jgi:hypothetical protein